MLNVENITVTHTVRLGLYRYYSNFLFESLQFDTFGDTTLLELSRLVVMAFVVLCTIITVYAIIILKKC